MNVVKEQYQRLGWSRLECDRLQFYAKVTGKPSIPLVHKVSEEIYHLIEAQDHDELLDLLDMTNVTTILLA